MTQPALDDIELPRRRTRRLRLSAAGVIGAAIVLLCDRASRPSARPSPPTMPGR